MQSVLPSPAPPALSLSLGPALLVLSLLGAALALRVHRSGIASARTALLHGSLPSALWWLVASLNPARPTLLVLTPFGAALGVAFLAGLVCARGAARRAELCVELSLGCYLGSCAGALLGARLLYVVAHAERFPAGRAVLALHAGGLAHGGALLGAVVVARWYFRARPLRWRAWLDGLSPALGIGLAGGSIGRYLQDPTPDALVRAAAGLFLSAAAATGARWQRFHGECFVVSAIGYGIVQLSVGAMSSAPARVPAAEVNAVAHWLGVVLAGAAGSVWRKGFTSR